ncbi:MAG: hypothetical protein KDJ77_14315 [Rhodobiaceae bacterium]|nr:hypothetical protein [Rhodobiaceae bacterium]
MRTALARSGEALTVSLFGTEVDLSGAPAAPRLTDGEIFVGIRPEHLQIGGEGPSFEIVPSLVERLGSEQFVYAGLPEAHKMGADVARARADEQADTFIGRFMNAPKIEVGKPLPVSFASDNTHFFDPRTQRAI